MPPTEHLDYSVRHEVVRLTHSDVIESGMSRSVCIILIGSGHYLWPGGSQKWDGGIENFLRFREWALKKKLGSTEWASKKFFLKIFLAAAPFYLSLYTPSNIP